MSVYVSERLLISELFETYRLDFIVFKGLSAKTEESYVVAKKDFVRFAGDIPVDEITLRLVREWKQHLEKRVSVPTLRGYIICLRVVLRYAQKMGMNVLDAELIPLPKRPDKIPPYKTADEVTMFIDAAGGPIRGCSRVNKLRNQALIATLYASGVRASELCALDRDSIRDRTFTIVGKGGKARLCFIDDRAAMYIDAYLKARTDSHPALFIAGQSGNRLTSKMLQLICRTISARCGTKIHPHTFRHSYATNLLKNNANLRYVQELLGHSDLRTTQMYTHVVNADLEAVYRAHHTV